MHPQRFYNGTPHIRRPPPIVVTRRRLLSLEEALRQAPPHPAAMEHQTYIAVPTFRRFSVPEYRQQAEFRPFPPPRCLHPQSLLHPGTLLLFRLNPALKYRKALQRRCKNGKKSTNGLANESSSSSSIGIVSPTVCTQYVLSTTIHQITLYMTNQVTQL